MALAHVTSIIVTGISGTLSWCWEKNFLLSQVVRINTTGERTENVWNCSYQVSLLKPKCISSSSCLIFWVRVVLKRAVVGDWRFDNHSGRVKSVFVIFIYLVLSGLPILEVVLPVSLRTLRFGFSWPCFASQLVWTRNSTGKERLK